MADRKFSSEEKFRTYPSRGKSSNNPLYKAQTIVTWKSCLVLQLPVHHKQLLRLSGKDEVQKAVWEGPAGCGGKHQRRGLAHYQPQPPPSELTPSNSISVLFRLIHFVSYSLAGFAVSSRLSSNIANSFLLLKAFLKLSLALPVIFICLLWGHQTSLWWVRSLYLTSAPPELGNCLYSQNSLLHQPQQISSQEF